MRAFIACEITDERIKFLIEELKRAGGDVKFVDPAATHVTLKFLGEIRDSEAEGVGHILEEICRDALPMEAEIGGLGVFPNMKRMRVIWISVHCPELLSLQARLDSELEKIGFKKERDFNAHLTIGRVRSKKNKDKLSESIERHGGFKVGAHQISAVKLKKSELTPKGPIYTDLKVIGN